MNKVYFLTSIYYTAHKYFNEIQQMPFEFKCINNTYTEEKPLGEGLSGSVSTAKNGTQKVVIKQAHLGKEKHSKNEIEILTELKHDHIVKLLDYDTSFTLIALECLQGALLGIMEYHAKEGETLLPVECFSMFVQIISAVKYMHEQGFIHRDIKPDNILYRVNPGVQNDSNKYLYKLCDFGLSQKCKPDEVLNLYSGTLTYAAPEQLLVNRKYNQKVDIWALGVVLFECITATEFDPALVVHTQKLDLNDQCPGADEYFDDPDLQSTKRMILFCLKYNPSERPTAEQVEREAKKEFALEKLKEELKQEGEREELALIEAKGILAKFGI
jgi:serine/threonine protein kinase